MSDVRERAINQVMSEHGCSREFASEYVDTTLGGQSLQLSIELGDVRTAILDALPRWTHPLAQWVMRDR